MDETNVYEEPTTHRSINSDDPNYQPPTYYDDFTAGDIGPAFKETFFEGRNKGEKAFFL